MPARHTAVMGSAPAGAVSMGSDEHTPHWAALLDELVDGARVIAWAEGIHQRRPYLAARNAAIEYFVRRDAVRVIAAETSFVLSRGVDAYLRGVGGTDPGADVIAGMWSWGKEPLADNADLLRVLRHHNDGRDPRDRVRFYGLDMFHHATGSAAATGDGLSADDLAHAARLASALSCHRAGGGDHRDVAIRDSAQHSSWLEVARRHPEGTHFLFEQVEHLDRRISGSLGARLAADLEDRFRVVAAVWREGDVSVRYPLGRYRDLSRWLGAHESDLLPFAPGTSLLDLRPWRGRAGKADDAILCAAADVFDAVLYASSLPACAAWDPAVCPNRRLGRGHA